jgi:trigger factor
MSHSPKQDQVFSNENITAVFTKQPFCHYSLELTLTPHLKKIAREKAIKSVSKEISIPGFRKGKAPLKFVLDKFGDQINQETADTTVNMGLNFALEMANLHPIKDTLKASKMDKFNADEPSILNITFESFPEVPLIAVADIKLPRNEPKISNEEEIEERLQTLLIHHASFEPVLDRGIAFGDFVDFTLNHSNASGIIHTSTHEKIEFADKEGPYKAILSQLIGLKVNEERTINLPEQQEKDIVNTVCIENIFSATLPEANDEFAEKFGASMITDLKAKIKARIDYEFTKDFQNERNNQIIRKLLQLYHFDVPQTYFEQEFKLLKKQHLHELRDNGYSEEWIIANDSQINQTIESQAEGKIRLIYLTHQFAKDNKLMPSEAEISQAILQKKAYLGGQKVNEELIRNHVTQDLVLSNVINALAHFADIEDNGSDR